MKKHVHHSLISLGLVVVASAVLADNPTSDKSKHSKGEADKSHVAVTPDALKWVAGPPSLRPGPKMVVLQGNPAQAGSSYTFRVKFPDGYRVPPHWHPVDENVTVLQGTFNIGYGERFDATGGKELPAGSYARMPKGIRHFAWAKGETIVQVHGVGPFDIHYVNPDDDPRKKSGS